MNTTRMKSPEDWVKGLRHSDLPRNKRELQAIIQAVQRQHRQDLRRVAFITSESLYRAEVWNELERIAEGHPEPVSLLALALGEGDGRKRRFGIGQGTLT